MKNVWLKIVFFVLFTNVIIAQNQDFTIRYQAYLNGDMSIIGNSIVNRKTLFKKTHSEYNSTEGTAKNNEKFSMQYINIDNKEHNFSSSSAFLTLNTSERVTLRYAGLYWAATYPYIEGKSLGKDRYIPIKTTREPFDAVKVKFPNMTEYQTIVGRVIYDGKGVKDLENAPYVAYADITSLVEKLPSWQGEYFVANVRSAVGKIKGGVAAGWTIVFIYEKENAPLQKFISYDGFLPTEKGKEIVFKDFETPQYADVKAKILGAALGADNVSKGNTFLISTPGNESVFLQSDTRKSTHFLNSSITEGNEYVYSRKPNSLNTLGFDIFSQEIENQENKYIPNKTSSITLQVASEEDSSYLFMTTLSVATSRTKEYEAWTSIPKDPQITEETLTIIESVAEKDLAENQKDTLGKNIQDLEKQQVEKNKPESKIRVMTITDAEAGYYVILGAFSSEQNTKNYVEDLKAANISASYFFNNERNLYYIYQSHNTTYAEAEKNRQSVQKVIAEDEYFKGVKDAWILGVNLSENTTFK